MRQTGKSFSWLVDLILYGGKNRKFLDLGGTNDITYFSIVVSVLNASFLLEQKTTFDPVQALSCWTCSYLNLRQICFFPNSSNSSLDILGGKLLNIYIEPSFIYLHYDNEFFYVMPLTKFFTIFDNTCLPPQVQLKPY